jgi:hypothetical protein
MAPQQPSWKQEVRHETPAGSESKPETPPEGGTPSGDNKE